MAAKLFLVLSCWIALSNAAPDPKYREYLMKMEKSQQTGGQVLLTEAEDRLSGMLYKMKLQEMQSSQFPPAMHFFKAKPLIDQSPLFSLLQKMPKGAVMSIALDKLLLFISTPEKCLKNDSIVSQVELFMSMTLPWWMWPGL